MICSETKAGFGMLKRIRCLKHLISDKKIKIKILKIVFQQMKSDRTLNYQHRPVKGFIIMKMWMKHQSWDHHVYFSFWFLFWPTWGARITLNPYYGPNNTFLPCKDPINGDGFIIKILTSLLMLYFTSVDMLKLKI